MRKNTQAVWKSWQQGESNRACRAVWTDGKHVWSYGTCIAALDSDDCVVMNMTKYSYTTSVHQNALRALFGAVCKREMHALPVNTSPQQVIDSPHVIVVADAA
jgi:hypothetical protein